MTTPTTDRLPPHSIESEQGVLGCCLLDPECVGDVIERLTAPEAWYDLRHRAIWGAIHELYSTQKGVDTLLVMEQLKAANKLEAVGGLAYLASLPDTVPSASNLEHYLTIVWEKWIRRRVLKELVAGVDAVMGDESPTQEVIGRVESSVLAAAEVRVGVREQKMKELIQAVQDNYLDKFHRGHKMVLGIPTGFNYFDSMVPGLAPGDYVVLAARPSVGKTALMMQFAENIAIDGKKPVAVFSMEMTAQMLAIRQLFQRAGASFRKFCDGFMINEDVTRLTKAAVKLAGADWWVDDQGRMSIEDIEVKARRLRRQHGVEIFFIDYLQLLSSRRQRWNNRNDEMAEVSNRIKSLAKELNVPIVVLAQLNRQIEQEPHRKPRLSDLRESGNIEQDADVVAFLYRPKVDVDDPKQMAWIDRVQCPDEWKTDHWEKNLARVNLVVEKQRNGPTGDCALVFIKPWMRFVDAYTPPKRDEE